MSSNIETRDQILALEVRPRFSGFAVFQPPSNLLDYGMRKHRATRDDLPRVVAKKVAALLDLYRPSVIVARTRWIRPGEARSRVGVIFRVVRREAKRRSIAVQAIPTHAVLEFFVARQCRSKHQRTMLIVQWFPELSWKLPRKRRSWNSENHRMVVFDATATALAFMNRSPPAKK